MSRTKKVGPSKSIDKTSDILGKTVALDFDPTPPLASLTVEELDARLRAVIAENESRARPLLDEVNRREAEKDRAALAARRKANEFVAQNGTWFIERLGVEHLTSDCADHEFRDDCPRCVLEQAREYNRLDDDYRVSLVVEKRPLRDPDGETQR